MGETIVFVTQLVDVSHEFSLTCERVEHLLLHKVGGSLEVLWHVAEFSCVEMLVQICNVFVFRSLVFDNCKDLD